MLTDRPVNEAPDHGVVSKIGRSLSSRLQDSIKHAWFLSQSTILQEVGQVTRREVLECRRPQDEGCCWSSVACEMWRRQNSGRHIAKLCCLFPGREQGQATGTDILQPACALIFPHFFFIDPVYLKLLFV